jgi:dTMP kinase
VRLRPGTLIVLEGLDRTGKTTQRNELAAAQWEPPAPLVTHMPSGLTELTEAIYQTTEHHELVSHLARQLLHLACHAENLPALTQARQQRGVILDRWWWSTVAYGWFGGLRARLSEEAFFGAINMVWDGFDADIVFLFLAAHEADSRNVSTVSAGYRWLASRHRDTVVEVPPGSRESTTMFLLNELKQRHLIA